MSRSRLRYNCLTNLPADILRLLTDYLSGRDICRFRKINKRTYTAINKRYLYSLLHTELTEHDDRLPETNKLLELDNNNLEHAADNGYEKKLRYIVEDLNEKHKLTNIFESYIMIPAKKGYLDVIKYLVSQGADVENDEHALENAAQNNHLDIVKYLVSHGAWAIDSALFDASFNGNIEIMEYLLDEGANMHNYDEGPINMAAQGHHIDALEYLLNYDFEHNNIDRQQNITNIQPETLRILVYDRILKTLQYIAETAAGIYVPNNKIPSKRVIKEYVNIVNKSLPRSLDSLNRKILEEAINNHYFDVLEYLLSENSLNADIALEIAENSGDQDVIDYISKFIE